MLTKLDKIRLLIIIFVNGVIWKIVKKWSLYAPLTISKEVGRFFRLPLHTEYSPLILLMNIKHAASFQHPLKISMPIILLLIQSLIEMKNRENQHFYRVIRTNKLYTWTKSFPAFNNPHKTLCSTYFYQLFQTVLFVFGISNKTKTQSKLLVPFHSQRSNIKYQMLYHKYQFKMKDRRIPSWLLFLLGIDYFQ